MPKSVIDLSTLVWTLEGWRQWEWKLSAATETTVSRNCDIGPVPTPFPGSVRGALTTAGQVLNSGVALQSRESEFIENRHWIYRSALPERLPSGPLRLEFESLDGPCQIWIAGKLAAESRNTHLPVKFDLGEATTLAGASIAIVFLSPPDELGQIGRTSVIRAWKPRFNYGWDWTPRIVQVGPARGAKAEIGTSVLAPLNVQANFIPTGQLGGDTIGVGHVVVCGSTERDEPVTLQLRAPSGDLLARSTTIADSNGSFEISLRVDNVLSWWRTGALHHVELSADNHDESVGMRVGFRFIEWDLTAGAPAEAEPWLLRIDGKPVFLRGVNWVPLRPDYADVPVKVYRQRLETYVRLGVNVIRVWGGGPRECDAFYDICDELGLLVWQELPLSSSGLDNRPPDDAEFVAEFSSIARHYAEQLHFRPCLLLWSGGNELSDRINGEPAPGTPLTFDHRALAAARDAIRSVDPQRKIVPTSPSGPRYVADAAEYGRGLHHDVHGPWAASFDPEQWLDYWAHDDAMLRSEVGVAGASPQDLLERYELVGTDVTDRINLWRHSSNWWVRAEDVPDTDLSFWVVLSQQAQAQAVATAASYSMDRFPACGGFIVWMGHDSFPCAVSLSLLDADGRTKPAAEALAEVFARTLPDERG